MEKRKDIHKRLDQELIRAQMGCLSGHGKNFSFYYEIDKKGDSLIGKKLSLLNVNLNKFYKNHGNTKNRKNHT